MKYLLTLFSILCSFATLGQSITIESPEDIMMRNLQLQGKVDVAYSFTARPYIQVELPRNSDSTLKKELKSLHFKFLPITWLQQYNSHHPYGRNDGSMIPAKGYQSLLSVGVFAELGPLSIQLQPEYVFATNPLFESTPAYPASKIGKLNKLFPGQSSIRLNYKAVSVGISSENLWWGPGIYNSLIMSNNAPGFYHLTFNSRRPIKTAIGSFEWQMIGGLLETDTSQGFQNFDVISQYTNAATGKRRYLNGLTFSYQPKFVKGLFLGFSRVFQVYVNDLSITTGFRDTYLPVLSPLFKQKVGVSQAAEDAKKRDQLISGFLRWVYPKAQTEFYIEFGWNDHSYNARDFIMSPTHSAAYLIGGKKIIKLNAPSFLELGMEYNHMEQSPDFIVRNAGNWYVHDEVFDGYTHQNQFLGAATGLGNNVNTFFISHNKEWRKIGLKFEKIQNSPQELTYPYKWIDYTLSFLGQWKYGKLHLNSQIALIKSDNYAWQNEKRWSTQASLRLSYHF